MTTADDDALTTPPSVTQHDSPVFERLVELERENHRLREQLLRLTREAQQNERVLQRYRDLEQTLLEVESLPALLQQLTGGMRDFFALESATLVLRDPHREIRQLLEHSRVASPFPDVHFMDHAAAFGPAFEHLSAPWLGAFDRTDHGPLFPRAVGLESIAIFPFLRHGRLFGSLNLGCADPQRFTSNHSSEFLSWLAGVAFICVENACNRERIAICALTDALTGLYNRRYFLGRLEEEIKRAARHGQTLSCLLVDADHFKHINDRYGHPMGDRVLCELANRMRRQLRGCDVVTRYGGEEFAVLMPQTAGMAATALAERIRRSVESEPLINDMGRSICVSVSIGVAAILPPRQMPDSKELKKALLINADRALYQAKAAGRNRVIAVMDAP